MFNFLTLDWIALFLGTIGTVLWAHNGSWAKYAAAWWLLSSILWVVFAYKNGLPALGGRDIISISMYVYGAWRYLSPKKELDIKQNR